MYAVVNRMIHLALLIFPINFHHGTKLNLEYVMSCLYSVYGIVIIMYVMLNIVKEYQNSGINMSPSNHHSIKMSYDMTFYNLVFYVKYAKYMNLDVVNQIWLRAARNTESSISFWLRSSTLKRLD